MAGIPDYSTTASSNATVGSVNFAEGQEPSSLNDSMRAVLSDIAAEATLETVSGTDTYTVTYDIVPSAYSLKMRLWLKFTNANTSTTPTLNVNSLGAKTIVDAGGNALAVGSIAAGSCHHGIYDGTNIRLLTINAASTGGSLTLTGNLTVNGNTTLGDAAGDTITANGTFGAIASSSSIKSASATAGVGYATGAGGTVTQASSKSTGVTLNKVCGRITTHNASLNNNATVTFTVTNSAVAVGDVPVVAIYGSSSTPGAYQVWVENVSSSGGSFVIGIRNTSGGALGENIDINFAVIKGVVA